MFDKLKIHPLSGAILLLIAACVVSTAAQNTAFNYQGKLNDSSLAQPTNGTYDMTFRLYDDPTAGSQIGSSINNPTVQVTGGIFTVQLDFGAAAFSGADRYLEISIRPAGSSGGYTQLLPRQKITSAPQSIRSLNAANATNATNAANATQLGGVAANQYVLTGDSRLSDARTPTAGSGSYIQNATAQQSGDFNISGSGTAGGTLSGDIVNAAAQYNIRGNRVLSVAGTSNLFAGTNAGAANTGSYNLFVGNYAGYTNTTGGSNSFVGYQAGYSNTTGDSNSFVGYSAGYHNTTGFGNSFVGYDAGLSNTTGGSNSFVGYQAGYSNTTGNVNSFFGYYAGANNTTGSYNSFFGYHAGFFNTTGGSNSFVGYQAGYHNTTGYQNSFVGYQAGYSNTAGSNNSFVGFDSGLNNTTGNSNLFVGNSAGNGNTTGDSNSFVGYSAGTSNTTGSYNTTLGNGANVASGNLTYATAIGALAVVFASNTIALGRSDGSDKVVIYGLGTAGSTTLCRNASNQISTCSSSLRYKTNIAPFSFGLNFINQLRPISFDWKEGGMHDVGFGAEEVAKINPLFVTYNAKGEVEGVKYDRLSVAFVNAFREQQAQIQQQRTANQNLQTEVERQQRQIDELKQIICTIKPDAVVCKEK